MSHLLFGNFDRELEVDNVQVEGRLPDWLSGVLLRTGPAKFEIGERRMKHWFDGLALLYRFQLHASSVSGASTGSSSSSSGSETARRVSFSCKFLQSEAYKQSLKSNRVVFPEFGTFMDLDPCQSLFQKMKSKFTAYSNLTDNGGVNLLTVGDKMFAITETPSTVEFDPVTLETRGGFKIPQGMNGQTNSAHPHITQDGLVTYNFTTEIGYNSYYHIYSFPTNTFPPEYTRICSISVAEPGYIHSFGNSQKYIILVEFPLLASPISFLVGPSVSRPYIHNFQWRPNGRTKFYVIDKENLGTWTAPPCFCFHHVNSFEISPTKIVLDMAVYDDASIVTSLYRDVLLDKSAYAVKPKSQVRRYTIDLQARQDADVEYVVLYPHHLELPRINQATCGLQYRFAYGLGILDKDNFLDSIHKLDVETRTCVTWSKDGAFPSEPVFVARPGAKAEDDGVVLSVVITPHTNESYLLVLDAANLQEIARAKVCYQLPLMLHGRFVADD